METSQILSWLSNVSKAAFSGICPDTMWPNRCEQNCMQTISFSFLIQMQAVCNLHSCISPVKKDGHLPWAGQVSATSPAYCQSAQSVVWFLGGEQRH